MKTVKKGDKFFAARRVHGEFERGFDGFRAAIGKMRARRAFDGHDFVQLFRQLRHMFVVIIGAANVYQFGGLVLNRFHDCGVAVARRTDGDARVTIQKDVAVGVFHPHARAAFGD